MHNYLDKLIDSGVADGWIKSNKTIKQGGSGIVCVVEKNGVSGVFKALPESANQTARNRFAREISVLVRLDHPAIMKPLAYSTDSDKTPWYITSLGTDLRYEWPKRRESSANRTELANEALEMMRELINGLVVCHENGIAHRDIKPGNIVYSEAGKPVLIDFGVAFDESDERLTSEDDAVGNARYSPDIMRSCLGNEDCYWVDVFELVQVLMWMLEDKVPKHAWQRPVHWKYWNLAEDIEPALRTRLIALAARCSLMETCPKNAGELRKYFDQIFDGRNLAFPNAKNEQFADRAKQIASLAIATAGINKAAISERLDTDIAGMKAVFDPLWDALLKLCGEFSTALDCNLQVDTSCAGDPRDRSYRVRKTFNRRVVITPKNVEAGGSIILQIGTNIVLETDPNTSLPYEQVIRDGGNCIFMSGQVTFGNPQEGFCLVIDKSGKTYNANRLLQSADIEDFVQITEQALLSQEGMKWLAEQAISSIK